MKLFFSLVSKSIPLTIFCLFFLSALMSAASYGESNRSDEKEEIDEVIAHTDFNKPLTIAINATSFPYHTLDKNNEAIGIMPDLWRLWAKKQQVEIEFVVYPWLETLAKVSSGDVDIHAGLSIMDSRREYLRFSNSLFPIYTHLYISQQLETVNNLSELQPYAIGVVKGSAHVEMLAKKHPELKQKIYPDRHALYRGALNNEILVFTGLEKLAEDYSDYEVLNQRFPPHKYIRYQQGDYGVAVSLENKKLLTFIEQGFAKITEDEKSAIERKWLGLDKKKDSLLIAFDPNYPPYMAVTPLGNPQGLLIDIWKLWSKKTGISIDFVVREMSENLNLVKQSKVDVLLAYPSKQNKEPDTQLAKPIYHIMAKLYVAKSLVPPLSRKTTEPSIQSLEAFIQKYPLHVVGIWQDSSYKDRLVSQYPKLNLRYFDSLNTMFEAAEDNKISAMIGLVDLMKAKLVQKNLQTLFYSLNNPIYELALSPLVHSGNEKLVKLIDDGFGMLDIKKLISLEKRWLHEGEHYFQKSARKVELTAQEQSLIMKREPFKVGMVKSLAPLEFINKDGEFDGIHRDVLNLISERTDLLFDYVAFESWQQLYQAMINEEIDMLSGITPTKEREEHLLFSDSYWQMPWVIIHPQYLGKQSKLTDFHGKQIAIVKGYYLIEKIREQHPLVTFKLVDNREQALMALQQERIDGFITTLASATQLLKQDHIVTLMISIMKSVSLDNSHFGVSKDSVLLKDIVNKGLDTLTDKDKQTIYDNWFTLAISTGFDKHVVFQVGAQVGAIILIVLIVIIMWNRRLQVEIKHREQLEKIMKHMATHDELTGLANRVLLKDRLSNAISFHQRQSLKIAVIFMDLDGFKTINDSYGHDVGDELLKEVAIRLQGCVRESDTVVRFGGDEFVLLLTGLHSTNEAAFVAEKALKLIQSEFKLSKTTAFIGCSAGIAMYPSDGVNDTELLKVADTLMYKVKASGKNHYIFS